MRSEILARRLLQGPRVVAYCGSRRAGNTGVAARRGGREKNTVLRARAQALTVVAGVCSAKKEEERVYSAAMICAFVLCTSPVQRCSVRRVPSAQDWIVQPCFSCAASVSPRAAREARSTGSCRLGVLCLSKPRRFLTLGGVTTVTRNKRTAGRV